MATWKDFKNWLEKEITIQDGLKVKIRLEKQSLYGSISEVVLTNFMDSLEATLDKTSSYHLFPSFALKKDFPEFFPSNVYFGKKTNKENLAENEYLVLKRIFEDWKKQLISLNGESKFSNDLSKNLSVEIRIKRNELERKWGELSKNFNSENKGILKIVLDLQELFTRLTNYDDKRAKQIAKEQLEGVKEVILTGRIVGKEKLESICQLKDELTKMEVELAKIIEAKIEVK